MTYHSGNQLIDPALLFEKAHLRVGMHAADVGCGRTGHIVFPGSLVVGEQGIMYAVDILKESLEAINKRARLENLLNVHTVWSDIERVGKTAIPNKSLDVIFLVNILSKVKDRKSVLEEVQRLLKDKSRCVVVDWIPNSLPITPKGEALVDFDQLSTWAESVGFAVQEEFEMGKYHRGVVLFKHD